METLLRDKILNSVAIMVIDIEGKTNIQAKREVRKRLNNILNVSIADVISKISNYDVDVIELSALLYEEGEKEIKKILMQYDYQIDQLIPQENFMSHSSEMGQIVKREVKQW